MPSPSCALRGRFGRKSKQGVSSGQSRRPCPTAPDTFCLHWLDLRSAIGNQEVPRGLTRRNHHSAKFQSGISSGNEIRIFYIRNALSITYRMFLEARVGIEPTNKGFAD